MTPSKKHSRGSVFKGERSSEALKDKVVKTTGFGDSEDKMARGSRSGHHRSGGSKSSSKKYGSKDLAQVTSSRSKQGDTDTDRGNVT
jgi:hypothetical protein